MIIRFQFCFNFALNLNLRRYNGVVPAHYDVVEQALLETLGMGLGEHFTPAARHAWQGGHS